MERLALFERGIGHENLCHVQQAYGPHWLLLIAAKLVSQLPDEGPLSGPLMRARPRGNGCIAKIMAWAAPFGRHCRRHAPATVQNRLVKMRRSRALAIKFPHQDVICSHKGRFCLSFRNVVKMVKIQERATGPYWRGQATGKNRTCPEQATVVVSSDRHEPVLSVVAFCANLFGQRHNTKSLALRVSHDP